MPVLTRAQLARQKAAEAEAALSQLSLDDSQHTERDCPTGDVPVLTPKSLNTSEAVGKPSTTAAKPPHSHPVKMITDDDSSDSSLPTTQSPASPEDHSPSAFTIPAVQPAPIPTPPAVTAAAPALAHSDEPQEAQQQEQQPLPLPVRLAPEEKLLKPLPDQPVECTKLPDGPEPTVIEIDYPATEALRPVDGDATAALAATLRGIASTEWAEACAALLTLRRLVVHHTAIAAAELSVAMPLVVKAVRSLRSAVSKTAIMTVRDMLVYSSTDMLPLLDVGGSAKPIDSLLAQLLLKAASNDKKFVIEEAQATLMALTEAVAPSDCLSLLIPYTEHKNFKVRGKTAAIAAASVAKMTPTDAETFGLDDLIKLAARLVTDNTPDARDAAKKISIAVKCALEDAAVAAKLNITVPPPPPPAEGEEQQKQLTMWEYYCQSTLGVAKAAPILRAVS